MIKSGKKILNLISDIQATIIFTVFYLIVLFPFAAYVRLILDPFRNKQEESLWEQTTITSNSIDPSKQF